MSDELQEDGEDEQQGEVEKIDYPKLLSLGSLHMAQYFPMSFAGIALPAIYRQEGLPLEMFWLLGLAAIPRWWKWLIALVVDNFGSKRIGMRKSWIIPCTTIGALCYLVISFFYPSPETVIVISCILVFKSIVMAAQDIAVDAYAAESFTDRDRATGTSIIVFMAVIGGALGGGLVVLVEQVGWQNTMMVAAGLQIMAAVPAVIRKEPPPPLASRKRQERGERTNLLKAVRRPESLHILPFLIGFGFMGTFLGAMMSPFLVDKGFTLTQIGMVMPLAGLIGWGLGGAISPFLIKRFGLRGAGIIGGIIIPADGLGCAWFSVMETMPGVLPLTIIIGVLMFSMSILGYAVNNSRFRWVSKAQAGTDYSMQSSVWNFGVWLAVSVSGPIAAWWGYTAFFLLAAVVAVSVAAWYVLMWNRVEELVLAREAKED